MKAFRKSLDFLKKPPSLSLVDVQNRKIAQTISRIGADSIILNIGSKNVRIPGKVFNVDISFFSNVHLVANAEALPIKDESVGAVFVIALLEIVEKPSWVLSEVYRVLKPEGIVVATTPFLQSYHPDPVDTQRFTIHGTRLLFRDFEVEEVVPTRGVFNSFLCLLKDYLAIFLSFNNQFLWKALNIILPWFLTPFKYLDRIMPEAQYAEYVTSSFTVIAVKKEKK